MRFQWYTGALLLGAARARDITRLESLYRDGTTPDTVPIGGREVATVSQPAPQGQPIARSKWELQCSSVSSGHDCDQTIDDSTDTYWQSADSNGAQTITVNLGKEHVVSGLTMVSRQDEKQFFEEHFILEHQIFLSTDGGNWTEVSYGTWWPDKAMKLSAFQPRKANYVRLSAVPAKESIAIAELQIYETEFIPPNPALGAWGPTIDLPLVPVAGAVDPLSGAVVTWSAWGHEIYTGGKGGKTQTATWHPSKHSVTRREVKKTEHDMFCPGISTTQDGKFVVSGGIDQSRTSIYNTTDADWYKAAAMNIDRGYQATTTLSDGRIFVIGGSFSGAVGGGSEGQGAGTALNKDGEIYDPAMNEWTRAFGAQASAMLTADPLNYRQDNHGWLFAWTNGSVFQAGPSQAMNWYGTSGNGSTTPAGPRAGDEDAMCGNAVMYDSGKILTFGGSPRYEEGTATTNAAIITIDQPDTHPSAEKADPMLYKRTFHSSVVLPDGSVFVNGGQDVGLPFNETGAHLTPERFIPGDNGGGKWTAQQRNSIVRVYHSLSLLLPDGTVFTGGGGLCGDCSANHFDGQIYTPPYLLNEDGTVKTNRPVIKSVSPDEVKPGGTVEVTTEGDVDEASIIRYGTATHTVNTDQRRIGVTLTKGESNKYTFQIPEEAGIAQPGYYMVFAMKDGVPSHSKNIRVAV